MDTYENNSAAWEAEQQETPMPAESAKASPFADSPYEMPHMPQPQSYETNPRPAVERPRRRRPRRKGSSLLCVLLAAIFVAVGCWITASAVNRYWQEKTDLMAESMRNRVAVLQAQIDQLESGKTTDGKPAAGPEEGLSPSQVYAMNVRAVVAISNEATANIYGQVTPTASSGSGFILTEDGYVVSNYHVIEDADHLRVLTSDGQGYTATVVGFDRTNDIALLKIEAMGLPYVTLGSSEDLIVGDQVVAIGNPLGELTSTLTVGYISAKDRMVTTDGVTINMLQTDAAINPGNSGGPLFNMKGEVIGITTAKYSGTTSSGASIEGLGFAIPMDDVAGMIDDLHRYGYITGAYLGVMVRSMDITVSQMYGLPMGAYVESVTAGSCAESAGIRAKDIITNIGGYEITNFTDLSRALRKFSAGDTTTVEVCRGGRTEYLAITFDEKPH